MIIDVNDLLSVIARERKRKRKTKKIVREKFVMS